MNKEQIIDVAAAIFRQHGYSATSLKTLSDHTGLHKSSLYHHFPEGKLQIALAVLQHLTQQFDNTLCKELRRQDLPVQERITLLQQQLKAYFKEGKLGCILPALGLNGDSRALRPALEELMNVLVDAFSCVAEHHGLPTTTAQANADQVMISLEGSLIVSAIRNDNQLFLDFLDNLPQQLLAP